MVGWAELFAAASTAKAAHTFAKDVGLIEWAKNLLKAKRRILILGASGAGKTQFINSLLSPLSDKLAPRQRTVAIENRTILLAKTPFILSDTPGQQLDEAQRKVAITGALRKKIEGVINVVSYGYHEAAEAPKSEAISRDGRHIARAEYLALRRKIEERLLSEWVPIFDGDTMKWVLTIATKGDLWWPECDKVEGHYSTGDYADSLSDFKAIHTVLPYCSEIEPFYGTKTSGRFGESQKMVLRERAIDSLLRLSGVER